MAILGIDVGGTFTDAVLLENGRLRMAKVPTARNQEESALAATAAVDARELERFTHGTTIATNALLERRGATTALVASEGFEHVLHLRRQDRAHLYRLCAAHPEPLVPLERSFGVRGRMGPERELVPLDLSSLPDLGEVEAIAVCLLFSFRDPVHEQAVAAELRRRHPLALSGTRTSAAATCGHSSRRSGWARSGSPSSAPGAAGTRWSPRWTSSSRIRNGASARDSRLSPTGATRRGSGARRRRGSSSSASPSRSTATSWSSTSPARRPSTWATSTTRSP